MKTKFMNGILRVASALQTNRHMEAVKDAFTALLPVIIAGAFFTLILNVGLSTETSGLSVAKIPGMAWLSGLEPMFNAANYATTSFFAIITVVLIAIELSKHYGKQDIVVPTVALSSYVALCQTTTTVQTPSGQTVDLFGFLGEQFTNAQGLFMAMIVGIIATEIYWWLVRSEKFKISMPDTVPSNVTKAFNVLFPAVFTIIIVAGFGQLFQHLSGYTLFDAINLFIQAPLKGVLTGLPGYLLLFFVGTVLWSLGIHGTQVLRPIYEAVLLFALTENSQAVLNNMTPPNILNEVFVGTFSLTTGSGITGGLIIAIMLFGKRQDQKAIAKLSIVPGLFNINETMIFGLPIVLNPIYAIPFMIAPIVCATIGYFLTASGFAIPLAYNVPWTTPPILSAFVGSGGHIGTTITQIIAIGSTVLIYAPFVLIANKQNEVIDTEISHG